MERHRSPLPGLRKMRSTKYGLKAKFIQKTTLAAEVASDVRRQSEARRNRDRGKPKK